MGAPLYSLAGTSWTLGGARGVTSIVNGCALGPSLLINASCEQHDQILYVGFVILTAVVMKSSVSWDVTFCSPFVCHVLSRWILASLILLS
jgi:hypothetical protein